MVAAWPQAPHARCRRSTPPLVGPIRPTRAASGRPDCPPSGIRPRHSGPRRNLRPAGPGERPREVTRVGKRRAAEQPDHRHPVLLRARHQRPRRRATKKRDELGGVSFIHQGLGIRPNWRCERYQIRNGSTRCFEGQNANREGSFPSWRRTERSNSRLARCCMASQPHLHTTGLSEVTSFTRSALRGREASAAPQSRASRGC